MLRTLAVTPRAFLGRLLAARSGHGDFAEYHERLGHEDATLNVTTQLTIAPTATTAQRAKPEAFHAAGRRLRQLVRSAMSRAG